MRQDLSGAIDDYVRFRRSQGLSKATLHRDKSILRQFLAAVGNVQCHQLTERHVTMHFETASRTRQPQTLANDHNVLSKFFEWARHTRRMPVDSNPLFGRRRPRGMERERNRIHVSQFPKLLEVAGEKEPRDRALVAVLLYTLLRDQEAADLRMCDVDLEGGWLRARVWKTGIEDRMPISWELDGELRRWLTIYEQACGPLKPLDHLLPARQTAPRNGPNGRFYDMAVTYKPGKSVGRTGRLVNPILERMGFPVLDEHGKPCGEGSHTIRRSGARALFDALVDSGYDYSLRTVQAMLHHKSMQQSEVYIGVNADRRSRDEIIRGKQMFPVLESATPLRVAR